MTNSITGRKKFLIVCLIDSCDEIIVDSLFID